MATYHLSEAAVEKLLRPREGFAPVLLSASAGAVWLDEPDAKACLAALSGPRSPANLKGFFLPAAESVARYGAEGGGAATAVETAVATTVLLGVRACELRAKGYLDAVLADGPFADPTYRRRCRSTLLVSCDCVACADSCCCTLVGGQPFATGGYDLNVTALDDGLLVDVASEAGEKWFGEPKAIGAEPALPEHAARRDKQREATGKRLAEQNAAFTFRAVGAKPAPLPDDADAAWQRFAADCVECGACTNICPTCHCFYLYDQVLGAERFERLRNWDSCLLGSYHRMAGGAHMKLTPRPQLRSRLANRVLHKFTYSPQQYGRLGCVGCGRCIDACLGAIDIRQVVQELER